LVEVPNDSLNAALEVYPEELHEGMKRGVLALSQRCTHLGCRLPFCASSGWFECGCHAAFFAPTGEYRNGPAPRGMDYHPISVRSDGEVLIDTSSTIPGLPLGTEVIGIEAEGPHCIGPPARPAVQSAR
jgi:cytochrome b6-f complex iron-sulfur subunit